MDITTFGSDARLLAARDAFAGDDRAGTLFLLPIPSERVGTLPVFAGIAPRAADTVVGYALSPKTAEMLARDGARVFDLQNDEVYLTENAELTALGVFYHLAESVPRAPRDLKIGILGVGRVGRALLKLFCFLGAKLSVYTTREAENTPMCPLGVSVYPSLPFFYHGEDVLVNTAPAPILSADAFGGKTPLIFDVASGHFIPDTVEHRSLPALPVKRFSASAAKIYVDALSRILGGESL